MNLKTAARRLGVHYQTAYRWVRSGQLVAVKVGAGYEISDAALERFLARRDAMERVPAAVAPSELDAFDVGTGKRIEPLDEGSIGDVVPVDEPESGGCEVSWGR